ncbi:MAG: response regulator [Chloroherpetonaceae bacterium]|nr:response regulator [Chloroherpetonaceae bacterium]MCS7211856.1 response regulator [Chloroherpetonaceae bacterium]MDW8019622.1 response regulator [Chloroherpetonaceae bacterium]MDW8466001.1 response regulator [Chloroherpetonaceae bacterium]
MNTASSPILFVDDEPMVLDTISLVFRGWHFKTAVGAEHALKLLAEEKFAVVVSDQRMPGMTGTELLRKVKELSPDTIRVVLTGYSDLDSIIEAINSGEVWRFINKPWDNEKLKGTVKAAVDLYEVNQMLRAQQHAAQAKSTSPDGSHTVLFIDKVLTHLKSYESLFADRFNVRTSETLQDALKILESEPVAVVACDSTLASEEGAEFLAVAKHRFPALVTIFMSDSKDANEAIRLINEGQIFRYLVKPFPRQALIEAVEQGIKKHQELLLLPRDSAATAIPRTVSFSQMMAEIRRRREERKVY